MIARKHKITFALPLAASFLLSACGGGGGGADGNSQVNNVISPAGKISMTGGDSRSFVANGVAKKGPISSSVWSIKQIAGEQGLLPPDLSDPNCDQMRTEYQDGVDYSAKSSCTTTVRLPSLKSAATWQLANTVQSPSGSWTDTVEIIGTATPTDPSSGIKIINDNQPVSVVAGNSVNISCTAADGQYTKSTGPKINWSYGTLDLNGQPYAINPAQNNVNNSDGSLTSFLKVEAPSGLFQQTSMDFNCSASDDFSTVSKTFVVNFLPAPTNPFNVIGGQTISGSSGSPVLIPAVIQDPAGVVTSSNAYIRWSQISGPSVIDAGSYAYGSPLSFTAPLNTATTPKTLVFQVEASATPFQSSTVVPDSQKARITYLDYSAVNGGLVVDAGAPQSADIGTAVSLVGTATVTNGATVQNQQWTISSAPTGSKATLSNANSLTAGFIPDVAGSYVLTFTVNGLSATGGSLIRSAQTVVNVPGASGSTVDNSIGAYAGAPQIVAVNTVVSLSGTIDPSPGVTVTGYEWSFVSGPSGSTATISNSGNLNAGFIPDVAGDYVLALTVNGLTSTGAPISEVAQTTVKAQ